MAEKHNSDIKDCAQTRQPPINTSERRVCIHAASISTSVKRGDTSSSIPHRLDNSSSSTSLLHIKKQCAAWGIEWAVERKQLVSCQGEHPEIISIIYHADTLWRQTRRGVTRTRRRRRKGEARSRVLQIRQKTALLGGFFGFRRMCPAWPSKGVYMNKCTDFIVRVKHGGQLNIRDLRVRQKTRNGLLKSEL